MISCTEFIPCYSELFTYLEKNYGREEVNNFWSYLFVPDGAGIPLIKFLEAEGIHGCWSYWTGTLNEEAADFTMMLNEKAGWYHCIMHHCPSKGRLLELKDELGIEPYHDYCLHCDYYRGAAEKAGFNYIWNFNGIDHAACSWLITDPKVFDGRIIMDENTQIIDRKATENEYFHRDFHSSMNMGVHYVGEKYGRNAVKDFLSDYTRHVYRVVLDKIAKDGLAAVEAQILNTYKKEKAEDAVKTALADNSLTVNVSYCPAVQHLHETGRKISPWYRYTTEDVMATLAEESGFKFTMVSYDDTTGAASYRFHI